MSQTKRITNKNLVDISFLIKLINKILINRNKTKITKKIKEKRRLSH